MNYKWLGIMLPVSLTVVAGAIGMCLLLLGGGLSSFHSDEDVMPVCGGALPAEPAETAAATYATYQLVEDTASAIQLATGDALFKGNCAQCHAVNEVVVGPALRGIRERRSAEWVRQWVRNPQRLIARKDSAALKLYKQYQQLQMPGFDLTDEEIDAIVAYCSL